MSVGYKLYREVRDFAPADWDTGMRAVAWTIADDARETTRISLISRALLCHRTGLKPDGVQDVLRRLARSGYEFRVARAKGSDGRPVYAAKGCTAEYKVPDMTRIGMASIAPARHGQPVDKPP